MAEVVYQSEHATMSTTRITIRDYEYRVEDIEEVSLYEGRESMIKAFWFFGPLGPLIMRLVLPRNYDSGLVVAKLDGKSDIIQGLEIVEAKKIIQAMEEIFKMSQPANEVGKKM